MPSFQAFPGDCLSAGRQQDSEKVAPQEEMRGSAQAGLLPPLSPFPPQGQVGEATGSLSITLDTLLSPD